MKQASLLSILFLALCNTFFAQNVYVKNRFELITDIKTAKFYPVLSQFGDKLLFTGDAFIGLSIYDFNTKQITNISSEAGTGYEPIFDMNDSKIFYRKTTFNNGRRFDAIESYDLNKKQKQLMLTPQRDLKKPKSYQNGLLVYANKKLLKSTMGKSSSANINYLTTEDLKIVLFNNNTRYDLNPLKMDVSRYLWVNISPNGKMILFTAAGKGTFICDLTGKIIANVGFLDAPIWYNDNFIVGMQDKDDGHRLVSSKIIMISINNKSLFEISLPNQIAMYPAASQKSGRIAYNTQDGKIYIAEIEIK
jgi:hypothetical protein